MNTPDSTNAPAYARQLCADLFLNNPLPAVHPPEHVLREVMGAIYRTAHYSQPTPSIWAGFSNARPVEQEAFELEFMALAWIVLAFIIAVWIMFSRHGVFIK